MLRITLINIAAFILPFAIFFLWRWQMVSPDRVKPTPTLRLTAMGAGLAVLSMIVLVMFDAANSGHRGDQYVPPRLVDGEIQPGYFISSDDAETAGEDEDEAEDPPSQ